MERKWYFSGWGLVLGTEQTRAAFRDRVSRAAVAAGFPATFWDDIAADAQEWIVLSRREYAIAQRFAAADRPERDALDADHKALEVPLCSARRQALTRIRDRYGAEKFDELLYRVETRGKVLRWSGAVYRPEELAAALRRMDRGCQ